MKESETIKQLTKLLLQKQQEARVAVLERDRLASRLSLLSSILDVLRWRRDIIYTSVLGSQYGIARAEEEAVEHTLLELERAIADHSPSCDAVRAMDVDGPDSCCATSSSGCEAVHMAAPAMQQPCLAAGSTQQQQQQQQQHQQQQQRLIAPLEDPLALFKHLFIQPPYPGAECMSLPELLAEYGQLVRELSVALQLHELGLGCDQEAKLQALVLRCLSLISTLGKARHEDTRHDMPDMLALCLTSYETGEAIPEPSKERHAAVAVLLGLSQQQRLRITQAAALFKQLLTPVLTELRQLQQQAGSSGRSSSSISTSSVCQAVSQCPPACLQQQQQEQHQHHQQQDRQLDDGEPPSLEQQQRHAARMKLLLRKDALLRSVAASFTYGCLTVVQLAKLHVFCSPYYPHPLTFVQAVMDQQQEQQQHLARQELLQDTESCVGDSSGLMRGLGSRKLDQAAEDSVWQGVQTGTGP